MKHIKIVLALTLVVVVMMVGVFAVEDALRPEIEIAAAERANLAKDDVLSGAAAHPVAVLNAIEEDETLDVADTGITGIYYYEGLGYVYQAEFSGFASTIQYMVGFDELGNVTGFKTLYQNDSPGYGAKIGLKETTDQLLGLTIGDLESGNFDGISGATFTTTGWKDSLAAVIGFHNNVFLGIEIVDVTASMSGLPISVTKVEEVQQSGTPIEYVYTVEFYGYNQTAASVFTITIDLASEVQSVEVITMNETDGIGSHIADPEFIQQFLNMSVEDATDNNYDQMGGVTYPATLFGFETSFTEAYMYHRVEVEGYEPHVETELEKIARWYVELSSEAALTDTTSSYTLDDTFVEKVEENDDFVILTATFPGFIDDMTIMIGFDKESNDVTGLRVLVNDETPGYGSKASDEDFTDLFIDLNHILALYGQFDSIGGATGTSNAIKDGLWDIVGFYRVELMGEQPIIIAEPRPDSETTANLNLQEAYPTADSFVEVYEDTPYQEGIRNIYAALDSGSNVIGYVYYGFETGNFLNVEYTWGVNNAGLTQELYIITDGTSWEWAPDYSGGQIFETSTFLNLYTAIEIGSILDAQVNIDSWSGVSTTTGGMRAALEAIAEYHEDNNVGGGN